MLFLSSGAVYGPQPESLLEIPESYPGAPREDDPVAVYGRAKRRAERACFEWGEKTGRAVVVARLFAFVGEELPLDAHFAIGNFIRDALAGGPISVKSDGTPVRSYLAASCLSEWLWVLLARGNPGWAFNVGSDEAIDMANLAPLVADIVSPGPVRTTPAARHTSRLSESLRGHISEIVKSGLQGSWGLARPLLARASSHHSRSVTWPT